MVDAGLCLYGLLLNYAQEEVILIHILYLHA